MILYFIIFYNLIYIIGHILNAFWLSKKDESETFIFFKKLCIGLITCTSLYAIIKTLGNTQFIGIFIITLIFIIYNKNKIGFNLNKIKKIQYKQLILSYIIYLIFYSYNYLYSGIQENNVHQDYLYYANIAEYLNRFGIESKSHNFIDINIQHPIFYHYFNEWLTALISFMFDNKPILTYLHISLPLLHTITYYGILSITEDYIHKYYKYILSLLFFFITGIGSILNVGISLIYWNQNLISPFTSKILIITIFIIIFIKKCNSTITDKIFILTILSILYITTLPSILGTWIILGLYIGVKRKQFIYRNIDILFIIFPFCFITIFYLINSYTIQNITTNDFSYINQYKEFLSNFNRFPIKIYIGILLTVCIGAIIAYLPFIHIFIKNINYINKFTKNYLFLLIVVSLLGYCLLQQTLDGIQIFTNITVPILPILIYLLIINKFRKEFSISYLAILIFSSIYWVPHFTKHKEKIPKETQDLLSKELSKHDEAKFAFILNPNTYNQNIYNYYHYLSVPCTYIAMYTHLYQPISLSFTDAPINKNDYMYYLIMELHNSRKETPFYNYIKNSPHCIDKLRLSFISYNKIDYLIIEKNNKWYNLYKELLPIKNIIDLNNYYLLCLSY